MVVRATKADTAATEKTVETTAQTFVATHGWIVVTSEVNAPVLIRREFLESISLDNVYDGGVKRYEVPEDLMKDVCKDHVRFTGVKIEDNTRKLLVMGAHLFGGNDPEERKKFQLCMQKVSELEAKKGFVTLVGGISGPKEVKDNIGTEWLDLATDLSKNPPFKERGGLQSQIGKIHVRIMRRRKKVVVVVIDR